MTHNALKALPLTRRRFLTIAASAAGAGTLGMTGLSRVPASTFTWSGVALGASASLTLQHPDEAKAKAVIAASLDEVARLERIFSLHRTDSALVRLNSDGYLGDAPGDLRRLLAEALQLAAASNGVFDPTVQPLWQCYAQHFAGHPTSEAGPSAEDIAQARALCNWRGVDISSGAIRLAKRGMAVTLNGMAQGYITDRVGELLRGAGFEHVLVNMGEQLALGPKFDGAAWQIDVPDPSQPAGSLTAFSLRDGAVATSSFTGFAFDAARRYTHILDARSGRPVQDLVSVTVVARSAARADGLSTALAAGADWRAILGSDRALIQQGPETAPRWLGA